MDRVFATPELFELIFSHLLEALHPLTDQEDPRSVKTNHNARVLQETLSYARVCRTWHHVLFGSKHIRRKLFLLADPTTPRSWENPNEPHLELWKHYRPASVRAPLLNPMIQTRLPSYNLRFCWNFPSGEARARVHCAFLIITRRDLPASDDGTTMAKMLLSQPPCTRLEATIYEERDETKLRTTELKEPMVRDDEGLTLGEVHRRVREMFAEHPDVAAIRFTTTYA